MYINIHIYICIYQTYIYTYIFFHAYILQSTFQLLKRMSEQLPIFHYLLCFFLFISKKALSYPSHFPSNLFISPIASHATRTTWVKTFPPKAQHVLTWTLKPSPQKKQCYMLSNVEAADIRWWHVNGGEKLFKFEEGVTLSTIRHSCNDFFILILVIHCQQGKTFETNSSVSSCWLQETAAPSEGPVVVRGAATSDTTVITSSKRSKQDS